MRHKLLLFSALVLFLTLELVAGVLIPDGKVTVASPATVAAACKGNSRIACTRFVDAWMSCQCQRTPDGWSIDSEVRATPVMFMTNISHLRHETLHVGDFRFYLGKHIEALAARTFVTRHQCDRFATVAMNAFGRTFHSVARISSRLRDGKRVDTSEDHLIVMKAEVVTQLVDDGLADLTHDFTSAVSDAENRTAKNSDLIRQRR